MTSHDPGWESLVWSALQELVRSKREPPVDGVSWSAPQELVRSK
jgi:hypothetical protein